MFKRTKTTIDLGQRVASSAMLSSKINGGRNDSKVASKNLHPATESQPNHASDHRLFTPQRSLDELVLSEEIKADIHRFLDLVRYHALIYKTWEFEKIDPRGTAHGISLHGPPGTGKTSLAEVIATLLGKSLIEVDYAALESRYVGETPKNISSVFQQAQENSAVLFFDEADAALGKRIADVHHAADQAVNTARTTLLKELDRFDGVVIFATNLVRNYDRAFVRRISLHLELPLPSESLRESLWNSMLWAPMPVHEGIDKQKLARETDGFSAGDIKNVVRLALASVARRHQESQDVKIRTEDVLELIESVRSSLNLSPAS